MVPHNGTHHYPQVAICTILNAGDNLKKIGVFAIGKQVSAAFFLL